MRRTLCIWIPLVIVIMMAIALRCIVLDIYSIPHDTQQPMLMAGDRVLVHKWAYGMHMPWWETGEYRQSKAPRQGDWIAFSTKLETDSLPTQGIGCLMACPGDTVWTGPHYRVSPVRDYSKGCIWPLVVPKNGECVDMTPWNINLYTRTINTYEGTQVSFKADRLLWNGRSYRRFRFHQDYYWVYSGNPSNLHDSRTMGFLPAKAIIGQATSLVYSLDREKPWYKRLRTQRTLCPLGGRP
ncbi:MAG: S26 family signal peptidase [Bacteroidaceae bacterium]